jgi:hypothetical protein
MQSKILITGGNCGWGDCVPMVDYSVKKLEKLGWTPCPTSNQAADRVVAEIVAETNRA